MRRYSETEHRGEWGMCTSGKSAEASQNVTLATLGFDLGINNGSNDPGSQNNALRCADPAHPENCALLREIRVISYDRLVCEVAVDGESSL